MVICDLYSLISDIVIAIVYVEVMNENLSLPDNINPGSNRFEFNCEKETEAPSFEAE